MIFDKYDKALWLMLKNDRKNRGRILEFIKSIPNEFVLMIQESIKEYNQYKLEIESTPFEDRKEKYFSGEIYTGDGYFYSYNIDIKIDMLFIGRSVYENGAFYNDFRISLLGYNSNLDSILNQNIGGILSASLFEERVVIDYCFINTMIGNLLLKSVNNDVFRVCGIINKDIPDDYDLSDVGNRFVRNRKKSIGKGNFNV